MELVRVAYLGTVDDSQTYSELDKSLISSNFVNTEFGQPDDYVELFVYDLNDEIVFRNYTNVEYKVGENVNPVSGLTNQVSLDPERDIRSAGIDRGSVVVQYNFFRRLLASQAGRRFWISEISPTRTEIKAARQDISNDELSTAFDTFSATLAAENYYPDFYLNFGDDVEVIGVNAVYTEEEGVAYVIFKLYEPLPTEFDLKSQFWVVQKVAEPARFQIDIEVEAEPVTEQFKLRGPNYDIDLAQSIGQTTPYYNYNNLFTTSITSSMQQLRSFLEDQAVDINVDYSNFKNFIHFSSATERVLNFVYKLRLIELYQSSSAALATVAPGTITTQIINNSTNTLQQSIDNIISKFDPYEYYLYFSSASTAWPKSNDVEPYTLYSVTSSQALAWLGNANTEPSENNLSILYSASLYDETNSDGLRYTAPTYIREDDANQPYLVFLDMIGQHFDNVWLYYRDVSNKYAGDNNPDSGISLDLVSEALRGFGMQLYTNTNVSDNIYYSLLGIGNEGSTLPLTSSLYAQITLASSSLYPNAQSESFLLTEVPEYVTTEDAFYISLDGVMRPRLSSSIYLPPFGNEQYDRYVTPFKVSTSGITSSFDQLSPARVEQEIYKRIYHNLPYLLKTKGTERGVRALIACYGIPNSILTINEYGGHRMFTDPDVQGIQDNKIYTGSGVELSNKLLSPHVSIQEYDNNFSKNSPNVEVAFTPADSINADITSSLPNLSIQQLIGNPALQYSSSYDTLVDVANTYFKANYTKGYNVWDFIRIIKFYNNSLFKMLQDFVPARASLTTGIVIKSHMLERNKYARHEPTVTTSSFEDSIKMVSVSASDASQIKYSTAYTSFVQTLSGSVRVNNIYSAEKYTGEFGGSKIVVTDGEALSQLDYSISATSGSIVGTINYGALFQNVTSSVKSTRFFDLDYSTDAVTPVNLGLITKSISEGPAALSDPYAPFAQLQDYNYFLRRSIIPRYEGSKIISKQYNTYTEGDISYGLSAAIDRNSYKLGWVKNIPNKTLNFPDKTQVYLKYLVDSDSNVIDLSLNNTNLVEVQNIFKSGDAVKVSISDINKPSKQKTLDGFKRIYRGGFSFDPIFYNEGSVFHNFRLNEPLYVESLPAGVKGHSLNWISGIAGYNKELPSIIGSVMSGILNIYPSAVPTTDTTKVGFYWSKNYGEELENVRIPTGYPDINQENFSEQFPDLNKYDWTCFEVAVDNERKPYNDPTALSYPNDIQGGFTHNLKYKDESVRDAILGAINSKISAPANKLSITDIPIFTDKGGRINYAGTGKRYQLSTALSEPANYKFKFIFDDVEYTLREQADIGEPKTQKIFQDRLLTNIAEPLIFTMEPIRRPCYVFDDLFNFNIYSSSIYDFQNSNTGPGFYRELSDVTNAGDSLFVAPRTGTYSISGSFPVFFRFSYDSFIQSFTQDYLYTVLNQGSGGGGFNIRWNIPLESLTLQEGDPPWYEGFFRFDSFFDLYPRTGLSDRDRSTAIPAQTLLNGYNFSGGPSHETVIAGARDIVNRGLQSLGMTRTTQQSVTYQTTTRTLDFVTINDISAKLSDSFQLVGQGYTNRSNNFYVVDGSYPRALFALATHPYMVSNSGFTQSDYLEKNTTFRYPGFSFRFYGVIEKCSNINSTTPKWDYVCSTKIQNYDFFGKTLNQCDGDNNFVNIAPAYGSGVIYDSENKISNSVDHDEIRAAFTCVFAGDQKLDGKRPIGIDSVELEAGDVLRFRFFLLDFDSFTNMYGRSFTMEIGKPDISNTNTKLGYPQFSTVQLTTLSGLTRTNLTTIPTPNFSIIDNTQLFDVYEYVTTVSGSKVYSVEGNSLVIDKSFTRVLATGSTYEPQAPASDNYSPVVDEFQVKTGDLVRFGAFAGNEVKYYTVARAGFENTSKLTTRVAFDPVTDPGVTATTLRITTFPENYTTRGLIDAEQTEVYKFFKAIKDSGSGFKITRTSFFKPVTGIGTPENPVLGFIQTINIKKDVSRVGSGSMITIYLEVYVTNLRTNRIGRIVANENPRSPNPSPGVLVDTTFEVVHPDEQSEKLFKSLSNNYRITLDTDTLDAGNIIINGQQLAILRPKPDETSVVLDFKKRQEGEVAQTVLIPQDASKELLDSVGTIYENLNTSLTNQL